MNAAVVARVKWAAGEQVIRDPWLTTHPEKLASQCDTERAGFARVGT